MASFIRSIRNLFYADPAVASDEDEQKLVGVAEEEYTEQMQTTTWGVVACVSLCILCICLCCLLLFKGKSSSAPVCPPCYAQPMQVPQMYQMPIPQQFNYPQPM